MKKFLKNSLFFCIPLCLLFVCASIISKKLMREYGNYKLDNKTEIIFLGHSQPECGINDSLIVNSKNLAQGGETYIYTLQKLKKIVADNPNIKNVFLSFSNNQIQELMNEWTYGDKTITEYYPKYSFMMESKDIQLFIKNNFSSFLSSETKAIASDLNVIIHKNKNRLHNRHWGGYLYLVRNKTDSLLNNKYLNKLKKAQNHNLSTININYLKEIIGYCKTHKLELFLMRLPVHKAYFAIENEADFLTVKSKNCKGIPFLDFNDFNATNNEFGDLDHLNHVGAKRFSIFLNKLIIKGLLQSKNPQELINLEMKMNLINKPISTVKPI